MLQTPRLTLRRLTREDYGFVKKMLSDPEVMYAYEHGFSDDEVEAWLTRQLTRYRDFGFGLWAVETKESGALIGQCGVTMQEIGAGRTVPEVGYLFCKEVWHNGYATEAAAACKEYAFTALDFPEVYSIVRETNAPSRRVAERNGMTEAGRIVKRYYGMDMPHILYRAVRT